MMLKKISYFYLFIWIACLVYASLSPPKNIPDLFFFKNADKVVHFLMYLGLTILIIPVFYKENCYTKSYLFSLLIASLTGIFMEFLQMVATELRFGSISDAIANFLGSVAGILIFHFLIRKTVMKNIFFKT